MPLYDKRIQPFYTFLDTFFSIVRLIFQTKFKETSQMCHQHEKCLILGNGPSLIKTLEENKEKLLEYDALAVNFFATTQEYVKYRPNKYVLCDPAFWYAVPSEDLHAKVDLLFHTMASVTDWPLQLYIPHQAAKCQRMIDLIKPNKNISLHFYNKTKYEGWGQTFIYRKQWGMPRAQNVVNAALMLAIHSNYKKIYLAGVDNDWISNIWVDEDNNVRLNDTHFYDFQEAKKSARFFSMTIDESLLCFYFSFYTYTAINSYAQKRDSTIINTNPLSYIDVFKKNINL